MSGRRVLASRVNRLPGYARRRIGMFTGVPMGRNRISRYDRAAQLRNMLRRRPNGMSNAAVRLLSMTYGMYPQPTAMEIQRDYRQYMRNYRAPAAAVVRYISLTTGHSEPMVRNAIRMGRFVVNPYQVRRPRRMYRRRR